MKKGISLLLAVLLLVGNLPTAAFAEETQPAAYYSGSCGSNASWSLDTSTGVLNITGSGSIQDYNYSGQPWQSYKDSITSITIDSSITGIGNYAFNGC